MMSLSVPETFYGVHLPQGQADEAGRVTPTGFALVQA